MQPVYKDDHGTLRFKENAIVRHLLDNGGIDLNQLAMLHFEDEEREHFAQLIGYSLAGFLELGYVRDESILRAQAMPPLDKTELEVENDYLRDQLLEVEQKLRDLAEVVFYIHPDDLKGRIQRAKPSE